MTYAVQNSNAVTSRFIEGPVSDFVLKMSVLDSKINNSQDSSYNKKYVQEVRDVENEFFDAFAEENERFGGYIDSPKKLFPHKNDTPDQLGSKEQHLSFLRDVQQRIIPLYMGSPIHQRPLSKVLEGHQTGNFAFPGDLGTLTHIYTNKPVAENGFGHTLDLLFLEYPLAEAIKGRIEKVGQILYDDIMGSEGPYKAVSLASGPAQEWATILPLIPDERKKDLTIMLLDNDSVAIADSQRRLSAVQGNANIIYLNNKIQEAIPMSPNFDSTLFEKMKDSEFVYTVGLGDYMNDLINLAVTDAQYNLASEKGKILTSFKESSRYNPYPYFSKAMWVFKRDGREKKNVIYLFNNNLPWPKDTKRDDFRDSRTGIVYGLLWDKAA